MNIWLMILYVFLFFFYLCHPIMIICLLSLRVKYYLYYNWFVNLVDIQDSPKEPTTPQENGLPAQETSKWHVHELCVYICRYSKLHRIPFSFISQFFFLFCFFLQEFFFLVTLLKCCFQDCLRLTYFVGNCISFYIYIYVYVFMMIIYIFFLLAFIICILTFYCWCNMSLTLFTSLSTLCYIWNSYIHVLHFIALVPASLPFYILFFSFIYFLFFPFSLSLRISR